MKRNIIPIQTLKSDITHSLLKKGLPESSINQLLPLFQSIEVPAKHLLIKPTQQWDQFIIIRQGIIRLYYLDSEGKESNKGFFTEGQIAAPMAKSAIEQPAQFYVEALSDLQAYTSSYKELAQLLKKIEYGENLLHNLAADLLEDKIQRELMFLQLNAKERYKYFIKAYPDLHKRIPLKHLASYLGMTDVSLSRIRNNLTNVKA